jgi:hypothetical protein
MSFLPPLEEIPHFSPPPWRKLSRFLHPGENSDFFSILTYFAFQVTVHLSHALNRRSECWTDMSGAPSPRKERPMPEESDGRAKYLKLARFGCVSAG